MMKTLIALIPAIFISALGISQEKNIETKSVELDNLISFVVQNYDSKDKRIKNITFLIQVSESGLDTEGEIVLKQAFKLLSTRLNEDDTIAIVTYSGFNGLALKQTSPKELKMILFVIDDIKPNVKEFHKDGIELAYSYTKENFIEDAINSVVMIRHSNSAIANNAYINPSLTQPTKKKNNAVLITAMSLLPELLAIIKDKP